MNKIRNHIKGNFTMIPNDLIEDSSLSDRARFLYVSLAAKPDSWTFYTQQLSKSLGLHKDTFRKYRDELCSKGWIKTESKKCADGKFATIDYHIFPVPIINIEESQKSSDVEKRRNSRSRKNSATENSGDGKTTTVNNKDVKEKNTFRKKEKNNINNLEETKNSTSQNPNPRQ